MKFCEIFSSQQPLNFLTITISFQLEAESLLKTVTMENINFQPTIKTNKKISRPRYKRYTEEVLEYAVTQVLEKKITSYGAGKKYGIPRTTVENRVKRHRFVRSLKCKKISRNKHEGHSERRVLNQETSNFTSSNGNFFLNLFFTRGSFIYYVTLTGGGGRGRKIYCASY